MAIFDSTSIMLREAVAMSPVGDNMIDSDDNAWRPLTIGGAKEELTPTTRDRMCKISRFLYLTNPLARRIIELMVAYTIGNGVTIRAVDPSVQTVIDKFWNDPVNQWPAKLPTRVRELCLYGELCFPVVVNEMDGSVRLRWISPLDISNIIADPDNVQIATTIELSSSIVKGNKDSLDIIRWDDKQQRLAGEAFFFAINKCSDATRGTSDLLPVLDWIGLLDEIMFNINERTAHMNSWLWDVTLTGASDAECKKYRNTWETTKIRPGSFRVHNEKVKWEAISPKLEALEVTSIARLFKIYIFSGVGIPEHFFSESQETKSAASEVAESSYHTFEERQQTIKGILKFMIDYVLGEAIEHNTLPSTSNLSYDIIMPRVSKRDIQRAGGSIYRVVQALDLGVKDGMMDIDKAAKIFAATVDQLALGVEG
jgi:hypothetical protein